MFTVVEVSFLLRTYSGTEGAGSPAVEVCLQIVTGTIDKSGSAAAVNISTVSQTAIGEIIYNMYIEHDYEGYVMEH